jgi:hypothetical protein
MLRTVVALSAFAFAVPALAEPMNADAARKFVAGKHFAFTCFDGSIGQGRIFNDGAVAGVIKMGGSGPTRFMHLPPGTLFANGEKVCSHVKGAFFNPCFNLDRTSANSFRGAVSGFGFAYCDFTSKRGREMVASAITGPEDLPMPTPRSIRRGAKTKHAPETTASTGSTASAAAHSAPVAAPTTPVKSEPLPAPTPAMGETGMRGSVQ